jgi:hypothetical protein
VRSLVRVQDGPPESIKNSQFQIKNEENLVFDF